jgi:DNA polymerase-3 subunit alpha (Gram-positive type)
MLNSDSFDLINELSFCVIDLETTGGNHNKDKIIEVGMVRVNNLKITDEKSFLINPETQIPDFIQKLTNISQNDVKDSPLIEDVIDEIIEFIGDDIIVAHNTSFDVPFLNGVLKKLKKEKLDNKVICTNVMTKHLIPEILNSNLNYMSRLFDVTHSKAHRAHDDAIATAKLLIRYLNIFIEKGIKKVNQLYYPKGKFELDRVHYDRESDLKEIKKKIQSINQSATITIKGERGLILAVIPLEKPVTESEFALDIIQKLDWRMITIKLSKPFLDSLFQFNNHYLKYDEEIRQEILSYLLKRFTAHENQKKLEDLDFLMGHHIIDDQVISYSFLHLNTNTKAIFKIPAQKKKMYQHLLSQVNRFEQNQQGRKKHLIHQEIVPLIENYISTENNNNNFLYLNRKTVKTDKESTIEIIEKFVSENKEVSNFPNEHL